jgi:integrase
MGHSEYDPGIKGRSPWNAGRKIGAKRGLKPQQVWAIRFWLDREHRLRDRAMFDLAIDSKLRGCDVVKIKVGELVSGGRVRSRAIVIQQKTDRPVQFELLESARASILAWLEHRGGALGDFVFPSRIDHADHIIPASMLVSSRNGSLGSACAERTTAHTRSAVPRRKHWLPP